MPVDMIDKLLAVVVPLLGILLPILIITISGYILMKLYFHMKKKFL